MTMTRTRTAPTPAPAPAAPIGRTISPATTPMMPALLCADDAALYLCVGRSHFFDHIRQHLPYVDLSRPESARRVIRYALADLDKYAADRRQIRPVVAPARPAKGGK